MTTENSEKNVCRFCGVQHTGWDLIEMVRAELKIASEKDADSRKSRALAALAELGEELPNPELVAEARKAVSAEHDNRTNPGEEAEV